MTTACLCLKMCVAAARRPLVCAAVLQGHSVPLSAASPSEPMTRSLISVNQLAGCHHGLGWHHLASGRQMVTRRAPQTASRFDFKYIISVSYFCQALCLSSYSSARHAGRPAGEAVVHGRDRHCIRYPSNNICFTSLSDVPCSNDALLFLHRIRWDNSFVSRVWRQGFRLPLWSALLRGLQGMCPRLFGESQPR